MTRINLLPRDIVIKEDRPEIILLVLSGIVCVGIFLLYAYISKTIERKNIRTEILAVEKELTHLQVVVNKISQIKTERDALKTKKDAIEGLMKTRLVYPIFMENMLKVIPSGMWLLNLNTQTGEGKISLRFDAVAFNNYIISDLLKTLDQSPIFKNPEISAITTGVGDKGKPVKQFSVNVDYLMQEWK